MKTTKKERKIIKQIQTKKETLMIQRTIKFPDSFCAFIAVNLPSNLFFCLTCLTSQTATKRPMNTYNIKFERRSNFLPVTGSAYKFDLLFRKIQTALSKLWVVIIYYTFIYVLRLFFFFLFWVSHLLRPNSWNRKENDSSDNHNIV